MSKISIYVGTYAKYNDGNLYGAWLDLEQYTDKDDFHAACLELHKDEEDPELMFQDWEGIPNGMISECSLDETIFDFIELSDKDQEVVIAYRDHIDTNGSIQDAMDSFTGTYENATQYAEMFYASEIENLSPTVQNFIDWTLAVRELECSGATFIENNGECLVFWS